MRIPREKETVWEERKGKGTKLRTSVCVCGGLRLTSCVLSFQCCLHAFFSLTSLHTRTRTLSLLFGYAGQSAVLGRDRAPRTRCRGGRGYDFLALSLCPFAPFSVLFLYPLSSSPSPTAICACLQNGVYRHGWMPHPTPSRRRSADVRFLYCLSCYPALPYSTYVHHAHMHICHIRPGFTYGSCIALLLPPASCLLPPASCLRPFRTPFTFFTCLP